MGGVTNLTHSMSNINEGAGNKNRSAVNSETQSVLAMTNKGGAEPSRLGHVTRTTEYTSHIGMNTTAEGMDNRALSAAAGGALSFQAPPGSVTPALSAQLNYAEGGGGAHYSNNNILSYPYSYD